jgi:polyisoprenoid-binding protein YceI
MPRIVVAVATILALGFPVRGSASIWEIDPAHTSAQFGIRHLMISTVRGDFRKVTGTVNLNEQDVTKSTIDATIDVSSINTGIEKRDEHLRSPDFLDAAKYPTMTFKSKKIEKAGEGKYKVTGDLTLHGTTREVVLDVEGNLTPVKDPMGKTRIGGMATTKLNRKDFGLAWNRPLETGGVVVGDEVTITIDTELTQPQAAAAAPAPTPTGAMQKTTDKAVDKVMDKATDKAMDSMMGK